MQSSLKQRDAVHGRKPEHSSGSAARLHLRTGEEHRCPAPEAPGGRKKASLQDRIAQTITRFTGSMAFVYVHLALVSGWVATNLGIIPGVPIFDPTFVILATFASVEAIFLSTFVLISQNRAAAEADRRSELDLQTNLLSEHEITRLLTLTRAIAEHLGIKEANDPTLEELERHVAPEKVLDRLTEDGENGSS